VTRFKRPMGESRSQRALPTTWPCHASCGNMHVDMRPQRERRAMLDASFFVSLLYPKRETFEAMFRRRRRRLIRCAVCHLLNYHPLHGRAEGVVVGASGCQQKAYMLSKVSSSRACGCAHAHAPNRRQANGHTESHGQKRKQCFFVFELFVWNGSNKKYTCVVSSNSPSAI